jgi:hypothetical protein
MMSLCKICGKPATGGVNVAASAASSVPSRFELRCQDHLPQFTMAATTPPPGGQPQVLSDVERAGWNAKCDSMTS